MKQMKKKKIEGCDDRRFYFFWIGVANDRLRNFPSCFVSSRMKKHLVGHVLGSILCSTPFITHQSTFHGDWGAEQRLRQSLNKLDETLEKFCFVTRNFTAFGTILPSSKARSSSICECISCWGTWPVLVSMPGLLLCFTRLEFHFAPVCNIPRGHAVA